MAKEMVAAAVAELVRFRLERLDHVRATMLASIAEERQQVAELVKGAEGDFLESLADDNHLYGEAEQLVGGLLLVGLYNAVEHFTKQLLRHRYPPNNVKQCYRIEVLQEALPRADEQLQRLDGLRLAFGVALFGLRDQLANDFGTLLRKPGFARAGLRGNWANELRDIVSEWFGAPERI